MMEVLRLHQPQAPQFLRYHNQHRMNLMTCTGNYIESTGRRSCYKSGLDTVTSLFLNVEFSHLPSQLCVQMIFCNCHFRNCSRNVRKTFYLLQLHNSRQNILRKPQGPKLIQTNGSDIKLAASLLQNLMQLPIPTKVALLYH